jgi:LysM repeat protein
LFAQQKRVAFVEYINQYKDLAVKHMEQFRIPASIILAQGILESGAGKSSFVKKSNNHFGIKCGKNWKGQGIRRDDDVASECFRVYKKAEDSYLDHSRFLLERARYAPLFRLKVTDYKAWAIGLQNYGYATDKGYAQKLIRIIEDYGLHRYDRDAPQKGRYSRRNPVTLNREIQERSGLMCVIAGYNDSFVKIANDTGVDLNDLLDYNDVPKNYPLFKGNVVYVERKKKKADKPYFEHVVKAGESMHSISQHYGLQLNSLYRLNKKEGNYVPFIGDVLRLR